MQRSFYCIWTFWSSYSRISRMKALRTQTNRLRNYCGEFWKSLTAQPIVEILAMHSSGWRWWMNRVIFVWRWNVARCWRAKPKSFAISVWKSVATFYRDGDCAVQQLLLDYKSSCAPSEILVVSQPASAPHFSQYRGEYRSWLLCKAFIQKR